MFRTERPWLEVYEKRGVEPETRIFEGSLWELFSRVVEEHRGKPALSFHGTTFEFGRLRDLVEKMAASLGASGVKKGDRVALMLPNCPQYVIAFFATARLGAIVTQINPMYVEREIAHILNDSGAETILVYADVYERVKAVLPDTNLNTVVVVDFASEPEGTGAGHRSFDDFLSTDAEPAPEVDIGPAEDVRHCSTQAERQGCRRALCSPTVTSLRTYSRLSTCSSAIRPSSQAASASVRCLSSTSMVLLA